MDAINFHLDLMGYSAMDHASIHYLQPLYNEQLDFVHVIKPTDQAYAEIRPMPASHYGNRLLSKEIL